MQTAFAPRWRSVIAALVLVMMLMLAAPVVSARSVSPQRATVVYARFDRGYRGDHFRGYGRYYHWRGHHFNGYGPYYYGNGRHWRGYRHPRPGIRIEF